MNSPDDETMFWFLFFVPLFCWTFSWYIIKFQLLTDNPDPMISVGYRFIFAGFFLYFIAKLMGKKIVIRRSDHFFVLLLGLTLFSLNYWFFYLSEIYITSAIPAIIFSTVTLFNILNERILNKSPVNWRVLVGALLGVPGVVLVFYSELQGIGGKLNELHNNFEDKVIGFGLAVLGTITASWGNVIAKHNRKRNIDILSMNILGMIYAGTLITLIGILLGKSYKIDWRYDYIFSFLYLSMVASAIAFTCYIHLIDRIGPAKSSFIFFFTPIGATLISIAYHEQQGNRLTILLGALLVVGGTYIAHKPYPSQSISLKKKP